MGDLEIQNKLAYQLMDNFEKSMAHPLAKELRASGRKSM
jgi:hypothetical protein